MKKALVVLILLLVFSSCSLSPCSQLELIIYKCSLVSWAIYGLDNVIVTRKEAGASDCELDRYRSFRDSLWEEQDRLLDAYWEVYFQCYRNNK